MTTRRFRSQTTSRLSARASRIRRARTALARLMADDRRARLDRELSGYWGRLCSGAATRNHPRTTLEPGECQSIVGRVVDIDRNGNPVPTKAHDSTRTVRSPRRLPF